MVRLNVLELLQRQGHTKYWLYKQLGMSYQNFNAEIYEATSSTSGLCLSKPLLCSLCHFAFVGFAHFFYCARHPQKHI